MILLQSLPFCFIRFYFVVFSTIELECLFFRPVLIDSATPPLSTTTASLSPVVRKLSLPVYSLVNPENRNNDQIKNLSPVVCFHGFDTNREIHKFLRY